MVAAFIIHWIIKETRIKERPDAQYSWVFGTQGQPDEVQLILSYALCDKLRQIAENIAQDCPCGGEIYHGPSWH